VWKPLTIKAADLVNGRSSWKSAVDPDELKRRERETHGGSYYGAQD